MTDNGPEGGSGEQGNDTIVLEEDNEELGCDEDADGRELTLARGNATVHAAE